MFKTMIPASKSICFGHLNLENWKIVSDFDIRISDFGRHRAWSIE
jgi:hypothetical protein